MNVNGSGPSWQDWRVRFWRKFRREDPLDSPRNADLVHVDGKLVELQQRVKRLVSTTEMVTMRTRKP
jgi:hypothetical protein